MPLYEVVIAAGAFAASFAASAWIVWMIRQGRDSFRNPALAEKAMRKAPYHLLDNVMTRDR